MLEIINISCERAGVRLLSGLGFCLSEGGFLLLKGGNGAGKTTLLKILAGLRAAEEGGVTWNGKPVVGNVEYRRELTFVGHRNGLKGELTVQENLRFYALQHDALAMLPAALRYYELDAYADTPVYRLSSGWQRRTGLARLLLSRAKLWLLDEPTNFLDQRAIALTGSLIETRVQSGGMVIAASHTMGSSFPAHVLHLEDFA